MHISCPYMLYIAAPHVTALHGAPLFYSFPAPSTTGTHPCPNRPSPLSPLAPIRLDDKHGHLVDKDIWDEAW